MLTLLPAGSFILGAERDGFLVAPSAGLIAWTVVVFALWLGVAVLIARAAARRGQSPALFFLVSLVFSPILAVVLLLVTRPRPLPR